VYVRQDAPLNLEKTTKLMDMIWITDILSQILAEVIKQNCNSCFTTQGFLNINTISPLLAEMLHTANYTYVLLITCLEVETN